MAAAPAKGTRMLDISGSKLSEALKKQLHLNDTVKVLRMNQMNIDDMELADFLKHFVKPEVTTLEVADNKIATASDVLAIVKAFPCLKKLDLSSNSLANVEPLSPLVDLNFGLFHLEYLKLANNGICVKKYVNKRFKGQYQQRIMALFEDARKDFKRKTGNESAFNLKAVDAAWPVYDEEKEAEAAEAEKEEEKSEISSDEEQEKDRTTKLTLDKALLHAMPARIRAQNNDIDALISRGEALDSFSDDLFPPNLTSLFIKPPEKVQKKLENIQWLKPEAYLENPELFKAGVSPDDLRQGSLNNCYVHAVLTSMAQYPELIKAMVKEEEALPGARLIQLHYNAEPMRVFVDELLPAIKGKDGIYRTVYGRSSDPNELWSAFVEKAYAKLHGAYGAIQSGLECEAMVDFTGQPGTMYYFNKPQETGLALLYAYQLQTQNKCNALMAVTTRRRNEEIQEPPLDAGIALSHSYAVAQVHRVDVRGEPTVLCQLRNPWGKTEYSGPWHDTKNRFSNNGSLAQTMVAFNSNCSCALQTDNNDSRQGPSRNDSYDNLWTQGRLFTRFI